MALEVRAPKKLNLNISFYDIIGGVGVELLRASQSGLAWDGT
jgi:hypothetical protein